MEKEILKIIFNFLRKELYEEDTLKQNESTSINKINENQNNYTLWERYFCDKQYLIILFCLIFLDGFVIIYLLYK